VVCDRRERRIVPACGASRPQHSAVSRAAATLYEKALRYEIDCLRKREQSVSARPDAKGRA
jgi:hypothetical protein